MKLIYLYEKGVSGAGKTTLLDVLAARATIGVISGEMLVDGQPRDASFQRKTGYVQQQDLHLSTATVREALNFSALLRQATHIPRKEKLAYVDEVIKLLDMQEYAEAIVGVPGEGMLWLFSSLSKPSDCNRPKCRAKKKAYHCYGTCGKATITTFP